MYKALNQQSVVNNNKIAWALFATIKLIGIVSLCLAYSKHMIIAGTLIGVDAILIVITIILCIRNMKIANTIQWDDNAYTR